MTHSLPLLVAAVLLAFGTFRPSPRQATAVPFADGVVSTPVSACVTFAPDGNTVYFSRSEPAAKKSSIMISRLVGGRWTPPEVAPFSGTYNEGDPALSPDGSRLVFWSWRPPGAAPAVASALWFVDRQGASWGVPRPVGAGASYPRGPVYAWGPSVSANGTVYFFRGGPKPGGPPWLSRARRAGENYAEGEYLDEAINGRFGGGDTAIAPDESYLVFSSSRPDSLGSGDLYVSVRQGDTWTEPRHLGPTVNSRENEMCPCVAGGRLYFSRSGQGIFSIPLAAIGLGPAR
jgi:hypothetical protein